MAEEVIRVEDFSFKYRQTKKYALKHLDFAIKKGEFVCVIGQNGSGKSTLASALVGLVPQYFVGNLHGRILIEGHDTQHASISELSTMIGLVFQNPFNQLSYTAGTVAEELAYGLCNHGVPREEMVERVDRIARIMRIDHIIDKNPLELSGGQVQRVALGSSLIMEPEIVVLDECTTQLDPMGSEEIFDIVKNLNADGMTVVMADHDMERVARCADRVIVLDRGEIVAQGSPNEVFSQPDLREHGVEPPDFLKIALALKEAGVKVDRLPVTEEPTIELVKEAIHS